MNQEEPECCGSGCTNCVLDAKPSKHLLPHTVISVFDRTYKPFLCESITQATENVFRFRFRYNPDISDDHECLIVPPGCHLMLRTLRAGTQNADKTEFRANNPLLLWRERNSARSRRNITGKTVEKHDKTEDDLYLSRPYTPITYDQERGTFDVLIKLEPGGQMTNHLVTLSIGSGTEWKGVYGDFLWLRNQYRNVVAFVQGVAIAPVYSTLRSILQDEEDETRLTLCACFRNLENVLLRDELRSLASYWNFKYAVYLSRRSCSCALSEVERCSCINSHLRYNEPIYDRRLEPEAIEQILKRPLSNGKKSLLVLLCGTESFTTFIKSTLEKMEIEHCYTF